MITKPLRISKIDWGNPLTRGMVCCAPCNEQAGQPYDLVGGGVGAGSAMTWAPQGINLTTSSANFTRIPTSALQFGTGDFTILLRFSCSNTTGAAYALCNNYGTLTGMFALLVDAGKLSFNCHNGGWGTFCTLASLYGTDTHTVVATRTGGTHALYVDGDLAKIVTGVAKNVTAAAPTLGFGIYTGSANALGAREIFCAWNRLLTPSEISSISTNPWQLLAQSSSSQLLRMMTTAGFSGMSRGRTLAGISRGRISCGY